MKSWYESKTIWLGLATIAIAVVSAVAGGAGWQDAVLAAIGAANIFLRTQTDKPVGPKPRRSCTRPTPRSSSSRR
jgi:hypothetical protein